MSPVVARAAWSAGWPIREALRLPIRLYRWTLAGVFGGNCRFYPSCSEYASLAIERNGAIRGLGLAVWRVLRCSPLSDGGVDPPPMGRTWRALHAQLAGVNAGVPDDDHLHGTVGVGA